MITDPVVLNATTVPGASDLYVIPDKCSGCKVAYLPKGQPRVVSAMQSEIWRCKSTDDCYPDEQLAIAVVFNYPQEVVQQLIEQVYRNEVRRSISMFSDYFEPPTITHLRETGVYPYPQQKGEESVEAALRRHENLRTPPQE